MNRYKRKSQSILGQHSVIEKISKRPETELAVFSKDEDADLDVICRELVAKGSSQLMNKKMNQISQQSIGPSMIKRSSTLATNSRISNQIKGGPHIPLNVSKLQSQTSLKLSHRGGTTSRDETGVVGIRPDHLLTHDKTHISDRHQAASNLSIFLAQRPHKGRSSSVMQTH